MSFKVDAICRLHEEHARRVEGWRIRFTTTGCGLNPPEPHTQLWNIEQRRCHNSRPSPAATAAAHGSRATPAPRSKQACGGEGAIDHYAPLAAARHISAAPERPLTIMKAGLSATVLPWALHAESKTQMDMEHVHDIIAAILFYLLCLSFANCSPRAGHTTTNRLRTWQHAEIESKGVQPCKR